MPSEQSNFAASWRAYRLIAEVGTTEKEIPPTIKIDPQGNDSHLLLLAVSSNAGYIWSLFPDNFLLLASQRLNTNRCFLLLLLFFPTSTFSTPTSPPSCPSDSLTSDDSLLGCDLLSHPSPHGAQSVSTLPSSSSSSCSSALLASGLDEAPPAQRVSGKSSSHFASSTVAFCRGCRWSTLSGRMSPSLFRSSVVEEPP